MEQQVDRLVEKTWGMSAERERIRAAVPFCSPPLLKPPPGSPFLRAGLTVKMQANTRPPRRLNASSLLLPGFLGRVRDTCFRSSPVSPAYLPTYLPFPLLLPYPPNAPKLSTPLHGRPSNQPRQLTNLGKTTLAATITKRLNARYRATHPASSAGQPAPLATTVPLDGFHLTRKQLDAFPAPPCEGHSTFPLGTQFEPEPDTDGDSTGPRADPYANGDLSKSVSFSPSGGGVPSLPSTFEAHRRRGAAFTFDGLSYLSLVRRLRAPITPETTTVHAPSFDHALKDPVAGGVPVPASSRIVLFEGIYVGLCDGGGVWEAARGLMDEVWMMEIEREVAEERLARRHVESGVTSGLAEARVRARGSDRVNSEVIRGARGREGEVIFSVEKVSGN